MTGILKKAVDCIRNRRLPSRWKNRLKNLKLNGLRVVLCTAGKRKSLLFKIDDMIGAELILNEICYNKVYFPKINSSFDFRINIGDTIIDIGANIGCFSVYAANVAQKGKVYCVEPGKKNFQRLKYHKEINKLKNMILINKGISDKKEKTKLYFIENSCGGHSMNLYNHGIVKYKPENHEPIDCVPLRQVFDKYDINKCDFLKIDCEGLEQRILRALPDEYFKRIDKIALEYHLNIDELELTKFLHNKGYFVTITGHPRGAGYLFAFKKPGWLT